MAHLSKECCPVCGQRMMDEPWLAIYCVNETCPVEDNPDLWYQDSKGVWKVQHWINGPKRPHPNGGITWDMTLSEKKM